MCVHLRCLLDTHGPGKERPAAAALARSSSRLTPAMCAVPRPIPPARTAGTIRSAMARNASLGAVACINDKGDNHGSIEALDGIIIRLLRGGRSRLRRRRLQGALRCDRPVLRLRAP